MRWLEPNEAENLLRRYQAEAQTFVLLCDEGHSLPSTLSVAPQRVITDDGGETPANQWVGLIDERPVVVQQASTEDRHSSRFVTIFTPFMKLGSADWETLRDLEALPKPIRFTRPVFVQSRAKSDDHLVCRPNARGWHDVIYRGASSTEADGLLDFLRASDPWNKDCFVTRGEGRGQWTILAEQDFGRHIRGVYPDVDSALHVACDLSDRSPYERLTVKNALHSASREFHVTRGRVEPKDRLVSALRNPRPEPAK